MPPEAGPPGAGPRLKRAAPILLARDLSAAVACWRDRLGFAVAGICGEPPSFAILSRDGIEIMLAAAPADHGNRPHWRIVDKMWNVYIEVDDADALHAEFVRRGATIDYGPCDQGHGMREFGITDADGHDIALGSPLRRAGD